MGAMRKASDPYRVLGVSRARRCGADQGRPSAPREAPPPRRGRRRRGALRGRPGGVPAAVGPPATSGVGPSPRTRAGRCARARHAGQRPCGVRALDARGHWRLPAHPHRSRCHGRWPTRRGGRGGRTRAEWQRPSSRDATRDLVRGRRAVVGGLHAQGACQQREARRRPIGGAAPTPETRITGDMDAFSRSSGAAWSSAARRHFRRDEAALPSRGAFRYRGTQVVTGARGAQARRGGGRRAGGRSRSPLPSRAAAATEPPPRRAFDHDEPEVAADDTGNRREAPSAPLAAPPGSVADTAPTGPATASARPTAQAPTAAAPLDPARTASSLSTPPTAPTPSSLDAPRGRRPLDLRRRTGPGPASVVVGALAATAIAAIPVVLGASAGAIDPAAPPALGTLLVGALIGGISGWLLARSRGQAA